MKIIFKSLLFCKVFFMVFKLRKYLVWLFFICVIVFKYKFLEEEILLF